MADAVLDALFDDLAAQRGQLTALASEYQRITNDLRSRLLPDQLGLLEDPARFKAALCGRRAGKTVGSGALMLDTALDDARPEAQVVYVAQTRAVAKRNAWRPLKKWARDLGVEATPNESELAMRFPGDRSIVLLPMEDERDADKLRGFAPDLVVFDECAAWRPELLEYAVDECVVPSLADRDGSVVLIGTPGRFFAGSFYQATGPTAMTLDEDMHRQARPYRLRDEARWSEGTWSWSTHSWLTRDNTKVSGLWERILQHKKRKKWGDDHPIWRREYLAQWVADATGYVYRYDPVRNDWDGVLPGGHEWLYQAGVDLGTRDAFAVVVIAWAPTSRFAYVVWEHNEHGTYPTQWAGVLRSVQERYLGVEFVGDAGGLGAAILGDLSRQHNIHVRATDKGPGYKESAIEAMNDDLIRAFLRIRRDSRLAQQMMALQWEHRASRRIEDPSLPNDLADACLYAWRRCGHHEVRGETPAPLGETQDDVVRRVMMEREQQQARERRARQKRGLGRWAR